MKHIPEVTAAFVEDAAGLWDQWWSQRQLPEPDHDYIRELKLRLKPCLKGATLLREHIWEEAEPDIENSWGGEFFVGCFLSIRPFDLERFKFYVDQGVHSFATWHALLDALLWQPDEQIKHLCVQMVKSGKPAHAALGFCALMEMDILPPRTWTELMRVATAANNGVAIQALTLYCSAEAVPELISLVETMEIAEKVAVSERLMQLGVSPESLPISSLVFEPGPYRDRMLKQVFQHLDSEPADRLMRILQERPEPIRSCIIAVGAAKRQEFVPWILEQMERIEHRRIAGWALEQILDVDLMESGWLDDSVELDEEWLRNPRDMELHWPNIKVVKSQIDVHRASSKASGSLSEAL